MWWNMNVHDARENAMKHKGECEEIPIVVYKESFI